MMRHKNGTICVGLLCLLALSGCATVMKVENLAFQTSKSSVGVFVCSAEQGTAIVEETHRDFNIKIGRETLADILEKSGRKMVFLNDLVDYDRAFKKSKVGYFIDEKMIGKVASDNHCSFFLIVYYSNSNINLPATVAASAILGLSGIPMGMVVKDNKEKTSSGVTISSALSLYGWMYQTEGIREVSSTHSALIGFQDYVRKNHRENAPVKESYTSFYVDQTREMFGEI